jgi:hypothetical protein
MNAWDVLVRAGALWRLGGETVAPAEPRVLKGIRAGVRRTRSLERRLSAADLSGIGAVSLLGELHALVRTWEFADHLIDQRGDPRGRLAVALGDWAEALAGPERVSLRRRRTLAKAVSSLAPVWRLEIPRDSRCHLKWWLAGFPQEVRGTRTPRSTRTR